MTPLPFVAPLLIAFVGGGGLTSRGVASLPVESQVTTAAMNLYVETTGNDGNGCGSVGDACLTIQGALDKVPSGLRHLVTITVGAGNFAGAYVDRFYARYSTSSVGLIIQGTHATITPATGTATGTATAGSAGSSATWGTLTDSGQSWTNSDLRGAWVEILTGTGSGQIFPIDDNTGTVITIVGTWTAPASGSTYRIVRPATNITTAVAASATATDASVANAYGFIIGGPHNTSRGTSSSFVFRRFAFPPSFNGLYAFSVEDWTEARITENYHTDTNAEFIAVTYGKRINVISNVMNAAGANDFLETFILSSVGTVVMNNNLMLAGKNFAALGQVQYFNAQHNRIRSTTISFVLGGNTEGRIRFAKVNNTSSHCVDSNFSVADNTSGAWLFESSSFDSCGASAFHLQGGPVHVALEGVTGTGSASFGIALSEGASVRITSGTTVTGTGGDVSLDGTTVSYATIRGASPKVANDSNFFTKIWER